jgi:hypothetical protein
MLNAVICRTVATVAAGVALAACVHSPSPDMEQQTESRPSLSADERAAGWRPLFDGTSLAGWHNYHKTGAPTGWRASNGELQRIGPGGDLVTDEEFANFELALDWKVGPGGNSGVMYRVNDGGETAYMTGPEMQVLDDARHADGSNPLTSAGAVYGLYPAPRGLARPAGEWNAARLVVNGNHVEHWLNGVRLAQYELGSTEWEQKVAASKFKQWPGYGRSARGRIALQDHGDPVSYRNVRIRVLP